WRAWYCGVSPQREATFTTRSALSRNSPSERCSPSIVFISKSWKLAIVDLLASRFHGKRARDAARAKCVVRWRDGADAKTNGAVGRTRSEAGCARQGRAGSPERGHRPRVRGAL